MSIAAIQQERKRLKEIKKHQDLRFNMRTKILDAAEEVEAAQDNLATAHDAFLQKRQLEATYYIIYFMSCLITIKWKGGVGPNIDHATEYVERVRNARRAATAR